MTSNLSGSQDELRSHFRPEFLNRVDDIVVFHSLSEEHLKRIVDIQLTGLLARLADRNIVLKISDAARTQLVRQGYDPRYGARPLKRAIQKLIETPIARMILDGKVKDGSTVTIDCLDGALTFG
jgi:ATP-dependent Clp protease ATP-binding subunit ClpB